MLADQIIGRDLSDSWPPCVDESEAVDAIGNKRPKRRVVSDGDW